MASPPLGFTCDKKTNLAFAIKISSWTSLGRTKENPVRKFELSAPLPRALGLLCCLWGEGGGSDSQFIPQREYELAAGDLEQ